MYPSFFLYFVVFFVFLKDFRIEYVTIILNYMCIVEEKMIQIYICEDEKIQLEFWKRIMENYIESANVMAKIVLTCQDPQEILDNIKPCDNAEYLFFIDIQMPKYDMNGIELAKKLREKSNEYYLVFITAKDHLAYKVFEYQLDVLDYIVKKPEYYLENANIIPIIERLDSIFFKINQNKKIKRKIQLGSGSRQYEIALEDIIYVQAIKGTHLVEVNIACKKIQLRQTLKEIFEKVNSEDFLFVNKSCIVQKKMILEIDKRNRRLNLSGGYQVEVPVREMKRICKEVERK